MIKRYWGPEMRAIWDGSLAKFANWRQVELAVLGVREQLGQIPFGTTERVREATWIDKQIVEHIERRDKEIGHDLNAFVEIMRCQIILDKAEYLTFTARPEHFQENISRALEKAIECPDAGWFHDGMTSYDTEEAAMQMLMRDSCCIVVTRLEDLVETLRKQAKEYQGVVMIGRTHGQHAQPITFGVKILNWLDQVVRAREAFTVAAQNAGVMKLSGAVGMYGTLSPEVEQGVGKWLFLRPVIATQIVPLDFRARVTAELAFVSGVVEKIADDIWLMCQTEVGEIREPFSARQKGSSAMPHKKNPIKFENIRGFSALVRAYAHAHMELCKTSHERDISHSGPERLLVPDAFGVVDHQLRTLNALVRDMTVFTDRMRENMNLSYGTWASQRLEMLLKEHGCPAEIAYRKVQEWCSRAMFKNQHLQDVISRDSDSEIQVILGKIPPDELEKCFRPEAWTKEEDFIYRRSEKQ